MMPLPNGSSIMMRSRRAITTRAMPTIFFFFMASRMTANASWPTLILGREVIGRVAIAIVDRRLWHELLDVDGVRAFDGDFGELFVLDGHVLVLADRIAFDLSSLSTTRR